MWGTWLGPSGSRGLFFLGAYAGPPSPGSGRVAGMLSGFDPPNHFLLETEDGADR